MKKVAEEQAMRREQLLMEKEKLRKIEEDKRKEDLRRQQEELQEINTLKGKFGSMINELKTDATSLEFTITGLNLLPAQIRILVQATMVNQSLRSLSMIRKAINDHDGVEIAKCMNGNQSLESLILEGNQLGPLSAEAIGNLIERNNTLRVIDLEGNDLTDGGKNSNGIYVLANALKYNKSLLCLNLTNTNLDAECGKVLLEAMKDNKTCIMLDITQNTKMGLNDVREIQKILEKNKLAYDEERFKEFMERKCLKREEDISKILQLKQETKEMIREGIDKRIEAKQLQIDLEWKKKVNYIWGFMGFLGLFIYIKSWRAIIYIYIYIYLLLSFIL